MTQPDLSIVILSWNTKDLTAACLDALRADDARTTREIIVVDNASEDGSPDYIAEHYPEVVLIRNEENKLYAEGNNVGARRATGKWLCTLNSDTEVQPGALDTLVQWLIDHPEYGAASPKLVNRDGSVQRACARFPGLLDPLADSTRIGTRTPFGKSIRARTRMADFDHLSSRDVDQPPGAVMVFEREEFLAYGGLDPALSLFFNDVDICKRLWADGRRIRFCAEAEVVHHGGASTSIQQQMKRNSIWFRNRMTYYEKHYGSLGRLWMQGILVWWTAEYALGVTLGRRRSRREKLNELRGLRTQLVNCLQP